MVDLVAIEEVSKKYENDIDGLNKEIKRIQSVKCRLKKMKGRVDYDEKMTEVLQTEQVLKEVRSLLEPRGKSVTEMNEDDITNLDYDETVKAIRSIQSKKTLSKWLTGIEGDNDEYRKAVSIEELLKTHRNTIKPVDNEHVRKSDLMTVIETIENNNKLSNKKIVDMLRTLVNN